MPIEVYKCCGRRIDRSNPDDSQEEKVREYTTMFSCAMCVIMEPALKQLEVISLLRTISMKYDE